VLKIEQLVDRCFHASGVSKSIEPLRGDASARRYYRVSLDEAKTGGVPTLIVMALPQDPMKSDEVIGGDVPVELPFVDVGRHLEAAGIRVPKIYLDATEDGALLLEDLGKTHLVDMVSGANGDVLQSWYEAAVELLATLHSRMDPIPPTSVAARREFDASLLRWELDHYREWGIEACHGVVLSDSVRRNLDKAFDAFADELAHLQKGFVHRDYQSRNLMVTGPTPSSSHLAIIDFQDAFLGPRIYDLVALLNDSYVDLPAQLKTHIVRYYANLRCLDVEALLAEFHLVTVQRKLKDGGRFIFIDRVKQNPAFLKFVEKSFARVREGLAATAEHDALKDALAAADPTRFQR